MNQDYKYVEELLSQLLCFVSDILSDSEKNEIQEFMDAGEYGLALETLVDIVNEENKHIPVKALVLVYKLADVMQLDKEEFERKLHGNISEN